MIHWCATGVWSGSFISKLLGDVSPQLAAQCGLSIVNQLMETLDNFSAFSVWPEMKKVENGCSYAVKTQKRHPGVIWGELLKPVCSTDT